MTVVIHQQLMVSFMSGPRLEAFWVALLGGNSDRRTLYNSIHLLSLSWVRGENEEGVGRLYWAD